ncbi:helix-turn-helix domain-containing protein [Desulfomicrobium salsuginis]
MVEVIKPSTNLSGLEEISQYARRSKATVLDWIKNEDFPAAKLGRVWESDRLMIDEWKRERIEMSRSKALAPTPHEQPKNTDNESTNGVHR